MQPEPWLRGPLTGVHPLVAPTLHAYQQVREDLARHTAELSTEQLWARPCGLAPVGFHLRHIAGSVDRLTTYLRGEQLTEGQLAELQAELQPGADRETLLTLVNAALDASERVLRGLDPAGLTEAREVGRQRLPTTVAGLVVHLAEHTMRHCGQAITTAQAARARSLCGMVYT